VICGAQQHYKQALKLHDIATTAASAAAPHAFLSTQDH
jgi:hypothetical protein